MWNIQIAWMFILVNTITTLAELLRYPYIQHDDDIYSLLFKHSSIVRHSQTPIKFSTPPHALSILLYPATRPPPVPKRPRVLATRPPPAPTRPRVFARRPPPVLTWFHVLVTCPTHVPTRSHLLATRPPPVSKRPRVLATRPPPVPTT